MNGSKKLRWGFMAALLAALLLCAFTVFADEPEEAEPKNGWDVLEDGGKCYYENDVLVKGWKVIDGEKYYFSEDTGKMGKGLKKVDGKYYCLGSDGKMKTGWQTAGGEERYFDPEEGFMATGVTQIGSDLYCFADNGIRKSGLRKSGGSVYFFDTETFKAVKNKLKLVEEDRYYFGSEGKAVSGWKTVGDYKYYFSAKTFKAFTGAVKKIGDYYYGFDSKSRMVTGKKTFGDDSYYFSLKTGHAYVSGLRKLDGVYYAFDDAGRMLKGWQTISGHKYYFGKKDYKGLADTVKKIGSYYYGFDEKARMITGWHTDGSGDKYYFNSDTGRAYAGVVRKLSGVKYCFGTDGKLKTGWQKIDGKMRYFYPSTGKMATGIVKIGTKTYWLNKDGVKVTSSGMHNGKYIIVKSGGEVLTGKGWTRYNGYKYYIEKDGYSIRTNTESLVGGASLILRVNKTKCTVNVLAYDSATGTYCIPVKSFVCSPGHATPVKRCYLSDQYRWRELMGPCWGQWCTRYNGGMLFHSVYYNSYNDNNTLSVGAWNNLGKICSHGCIRLESINAKWVYEHKSRIRYVDIYESSNAGPFGKRTAVKLPSWHTWDPTDPNMRSKCKARGCH